MRRTGRETAGIGGRARVRNSKGTGRSWPFRMREEIFAQLREPLVAHGPTVIVLRGPAGAGKSRIARECAAWHHRRGRRVTWVGRERLVADDPMGSIRRYSMSALGGEPIAILRELSERIGRDHLRAADAPAHLRRRPAPGRAIGRGRRGGRAQGTGIDRADRA